MASETTPLLSGGLSWSFPAPVIHPRSILRLKPANIHFLDNLRATLVFCLIFHHAAINVLQRTAPENAEERTKRARAVLAAFTQGNTQILWPTFFLVSGWAGRLSLEAKSDNHAFIRKRIFGTLVPAIVYLVIGRWLIVKWIDPGVFVSDSSTSLWTPYAQLTGPAPYILTLVVLDIGHVVVRFFVAKLPTISWRDLDVVLKVVLIVAAVSLVLHASALHHLHAKLIPGAYYVFFPGDAPGYGAPTTFIVAYMAGANGPFLQRHMLTARRLIAVPAMLASLAFAYFPSPFLAAITTHLPGSDVFYYAIGFFTVSWSLFSTFMTVPSLNTEWTSSWVQRSWLVAYVHVVPTIFAIYMLQTPGYFVEDLALRAFIAGGAGVAITWPLVAILATIWRWTRWIWRRWTFSMTMDTPYQDALLQSSFSDPPIFHNDNEDSHLPKLHFRPAYVRRFWWGDPSLRQKATLAVASKTMRPLPSVPQNELDNDVANQTLAVHAHLFQVTTPVRVSAFHDLLVDHPNRPFVNSVRDGLLRGFWPFADTSKTALPCTLDAREYISEPAHITFARQQRENEIALGRFSPSFPTLLPGMMAVPVLVVPKANPGKLRLIVNHSAGPFARNEMIDKSRLKVPLDGMHEFGQALLKFRKKVGPDAVLVAFKSDVKEAYRLLPMAPHWQMKQIVKIDGTFHVDWRNNFGGRASGTIWGSFFSLVIWIAVFVRQIPDLFTYVDDCYGFDLASNMVWYKPYRKRMPGKQVRLLKLWDELGIPHSAEKQTFGRVLTIIGFEVDVNVMSITLPAASKSDLIRAIQQFVTGNRHRLSDFQALAGWINWALNVYPLLHPCLSGMHAKMQGKSIAFKEMHVNPNIVFELTWAANHLKSSTCDGVFLTKSQHWTPEDADVVLQTDACMSGMGFVCLDKMSGFQARISDDDVQKHPSVNYWEALAVLSAFHWALHAFTPPPRRIVIYTNTLNVVHLFQSMQTSPEFNPLAMTAADLMLHTSSQLRVAPILGSRNVVADALSRFDNNVVHATLPGLTILSFVPPTLIYEPRPSLARPKRKATPRRCCVRARTDFGI